MTTISISEARANLPELIDRVVAGEEFTVTRHGQPVAVVVRPDRVRARRAAAEEAITRAGELRERLDAARLHPLEEGPWLTTEQASALLADVRASRASE